MYRDSGCFTERQMLMVCNYYSSKSCTHSSKSLVGKKKNLVKVTLFDWRERTDTASTCDGRTGLLIFAIKAGIRNPYNLHAGHIVTLHFL